MSMDELGILPDSFEEMMEAVRKEMEAIPPDHQVGMAIRGVFAALDELIALSASPGTRTLVCNERIALGQMLTRCQTLCSFAMATKPGPILISERV
jgi:hypothetical protein